MGREFNTALLADLPAAIDPCGERGEFHTFVHGGPMFRHAIPIESGVVVERDGFVFADLVSSAFLRHEPQSEWACAGSAPAG